MGQLEEDVENCDLMLFSLRQHACHANRMSLHCCLLQVLPHGLVSVIAARDPQTMQPAAVPGEAPASVKASVLQASLTDLDCSTSWSVLYRLRLVVVLKVALQAASARQACRATGAL